MENKIQALAAWQRNEILSNEDILAVLKHLRDTQQALKLCGFKYLNTALAMDADIQAVEKLAKARNLVV